MGRLGYSANKTPLISYNQTEPTSGLHCKKRLAVFQSPAGMSLTKLSLTGSNLIIPIRESLVSDIPAGDGKTNNFFYSVRSSGFTKLCGYFR